MAKLKNGAIVMGVVGAIGALVYLASESDARAVRLAKLERRVRMLFRRVCKHAGAVAVLVIDDLSADVNALADGWRIIVNRLWLASLADKVCGTDEGCMDALIVDVLAHELGHHVMGHPHMDVELPTRRQHELDADAYAGRILRAMGLSVEPAILARHAMNDRSGTTHPCADKRATALRSGHRFPAWRFNRV